jgi:hypothetical protein
LHLLGLLDRQGQPDRLRLFDQPDREGQPDRSNRLYRCSQKLRNAGNPPDP